MGYYGTVWVNVLENVLNDSSHSFYLSAFVNGDKSGFLKFFHNAFHAILIERFSSLDQADLQAIVDFLKLQTRNVANHIPGLDDVRLLGLKTNHTIVRPVVRRGGGKD